MLSESNDESDDESNADDMETDVDDDGRYDVGDEIENDKVVHEDEGKPDIWEDIYGRKRDAAENIINESADSAVEDTPVEEAASKYIPPARRNTKTSGSRSEEKRITLARLYKQLKGLLNRLAEANMHGIAREVEGFYRQVSRNYVNMTITDLLMSSLVAW